MATEPFSFEKKDFVIKAEEDNAKARGRQMKKLQKVIESRLSDNFNNFVFYVNRPNYQDRKGGGQKGAYRDHTWIGFYNRGIYEWQKIKRQK